MISEADVVVYKKVIGEMQSVAGHLTDWNIDVFDHIDTSSGTFMSCEGSRLFPLEYLYFSSFADIDKAELEKKIKSVSDRIDFAKKRQSEVESEVQILEDEKLKLLCEQSRLQAPVPPKAKPGKR